MPHAAKRRTRLIGHIEQRPVALRIKVVDRAVFNHRVSKRVMIGHDGAGAHAGLRLVHLRRRYAINAPVEAQQILPLRAALQAWCLFCGRQPRCRSDAPSRKDQKRDSPFRRAKHRPFVRANGTEAAVHDVLGLVRFVSLRDRAAALFKRRPRPSLAVAERHSRPDQVDESRSTDREPGPCDKR